MTTPEGARLSFDESVEQVHALLGGAIQPTIFWLHDDEFEARLTVDPDVAFVVLRVSESAVTNRDG